MNIKNLIVVAPLFALFFGQSAWTAGLLDKVRWGLDVEEQVGFSANPAGCESVLKKSLRNHSFVVTKTIHNEQGTTIFSTAKNGKHKAITKCMNEHDLLITVVIGRGANLSKATSINDKVKNLLFAEKSNTLGRLNANKHENTNTQEKEWAVQVGAFESAAGAEKLFEKLKVNGIAAEITKSSKWWKVVLSPSPVTLEKAKALKWQLKDRLNMDSMVKVVE